MPIFLNIAPIGVFHRFELDMEGDMMDSTCSSVPELPDVPVDKSQFDCMWIEPEKLLDRPKEEWSCFEHGGLEFPIIDWNNRLGRKYNHFWVNGFGTIMADR